jgi:HNH/ENDO VII superfamily nuclease
MSSHASDKRFIKKHVKTGAVDGGHCLARHISGYTVSSCSHRWQARQRAANDDATWYNITQRPGWAVSGTRFTTSSRWPYHHNAHHIIPNGVLRDCINDMVAQVSQKEPDKGPALRILVRGGLLDAGYNLNHKDNMIILPLREEEAVPLNLPRHLEDHAQAHEAYSASVMAVIEEVILDYVQVMAGEMEDHDMPQNTLAKERLEDASGDFRAAIRAWGVEHAGAVLDQMPAAFSAQFIG